LHLLPPWQLRCAEQSNLLCCRLSHLSAWILLHWWSGQAKLQCRSLWYQCRSSARSRCLCCLLCRLLLHGGSPSRLSRRTLEFGHWTDRCCKLHCLFHGPVFVGQRGQQLSGLCGRLHSSTAPSVGHCCGQLQRRLCHSGRHSVSARRLEPARRTNLSARAQLWFHAYLRFADGELFYRVPSAVATAGRRWLILRIADCHSPHSASCAVAVGQRPSAVLRRASRIRCAAIESTDGLLAQVPLVLSERHEFQ
jgi:hypothetical protein